MSWTNCEVREDAVRGRHVVATAAIGAGAAVLVDENLVFALEAAHQRTRCVLCGCPPPRDVEGVVCGPCAGRASNSAALRRWVDAAEKLGCASGSVALVAFLLAANTVPVADLESHADAFDATTRAAFEVVARGLQGVSGRDEAAGAPRAGVRETARNVPTFSDPLPSFLVGTAWACAAATNAHGLVDHACGLNPPLDGDDALYGVQVGVVLSAALAKFNHGCDASGYLHVRLRPGAPPRAVVRATRALAAGDEVTLCYVPLEGKPSSQRKRALRDAYFFDCDCALCRDAALDALLRTGDRDENEIRALDGASADRRRRRPSRRVRRRATSREILREIFARSEEISRKR